ncbi:unnamed protein product [Phaeothamnion confervicola]
MPEVSLASAEAEARDSQQGGASSNGEVFDEAYDLPFARDFDKLGDRITSERLDELEDRGWTVIENAFGLGWASALLQEMKWLHKQGLMAPNEMRFLLPGGRVVQTSKPHVFEADLHDFRLRRCLPELAALFDAANAADDAGSRGLAGRLGSRIPLAGVSSGGAGNCSGNHEGSKHKLADGGGGGQRDGGDDSRSDDNGGGGGGVRDDGSAANGGAANVSGSGGGAANPIESIRAALKLQRNAGRGGCFPYHYDNPAPPSRRRLTCLVYLNPNWRDGDGGELLLQPFLGRAVRLEPVMDRLVVFQSDSMLHRVLPARAERFCLTVWLDAPPGAGPGGVNRPEDAALRVSKEILEDWPAWCNSLRRSPAQRLLARAVYAEEFEASLRECMASGGAEGEEDGAAAAGHDEMLAAHRAQVAAAARQPVTAALVRRLRETKELVELGLLV